jgi:hypothetical protein
MQPMRFILHARACILQFASVELLVGILTVDVSIQPKEMPS